MHTFYKFFSVMMPLLWCGMSAGGAEPPPTSHTPFDLRADKHLTVLYAGQPLITGDAVSYLDNFEAADPIVAEDRADVRLVNLIYRSGAAVQFRREAAVHRAGALELTMRMRLLPYHNLSDTPFLSYSFTVPAALLDGASYKAVTGRVAGPKIETGVFSITNVAGELTREKCRYIAFVKDELRLVFDFNPYGMLAFQDYCSNGEPVGCWTITRQGGDLVFSYGVPARFYGGIFSAKILVYEGGYDYDRKHAYRQWAYNGATPAWRQFAFGATGSNEFIKADCRVYTSAQKWGWAHADGLAMTANPAPAIMDNCVYATAGASNTFLVDATPGCYLVTLRAGHADVELGPFQVYFNGECVARDVRVPAGDTRTLLVSHYMRQPATQLAVTMAGPGAWALRSMVVQPVIFQNEDFTFDRGLWLADTLFDPYAEMLVSHPSGTATRSEMFGQD